VYNVTKNPADMGRFKAPTLRNIAVTAPYMHDGSIATLDEVLDHYQAGGRTIASGPYAGAGAANPHKDPVIQRLSLSAEQRADLLAFLRALTDDALLKDPSLSSPF
jgi:cytochrome c peroxidase